MNKSKIKPRKAHTQDQKLFAIMCKPCARLEILFSPDLPVTRVVVLQGKSGDEGIMVMADRKRMEVN